MSPHLPDIDARTILEASFDGIIISDAGGTVLFVNSAVERITGTSPGLLVGKGPQELLEAGLIPYATGLEAVKTGRAFTRLQKYRNGRTALVTSNVIPGQTGGPGYIVTNVRDVTIFQHLPSEDRIEADSGDIILRSPRMLGLVEIIRSLGPVETSVLFQGETGVGKDVLAAMLHRLSLRSKHSFVKVNCGAIPENLLESELFGYEYGAFTGARQKGKPGLVETADKGTLFLDEIGELPLGLQPKLLELLQDHQFTRLGGIAKKKADIRVITATNRDLAALVRDNRFREDLYYRLSVVPLQVPPLRERKEEILPLADHFLARFNGKYGHAKILSDDVRERLLRHAWPGNIRELANLVERLVVTIPGPTIRAADLPSDLDGSLEDKARTAREMEQDLEADLLAQAVAEGWSSYRLARRLGVSQATAFRRRRNYLMARA